MIRSISKTKNSPVVAELCALLSAFPFYISFREVGTAPHWNLLTFECNWIPDLDTEFIFSFNFLAWFLPFMIAAVSLRVMWAISGEYIFVNKCYLITVKQSIDYIYRCQIKGLLVDASFKSGCQNRNNKTVPAKEHEYIMTINPLRYTRSLWIPRRFQITIIMTTCVVNFRKYTIA